MRKIEALIRAIQNLSERLTILTEVLLEILAKL